MIQKTTQLKLDISSMDSIEERIEALKDGYKDETAYLVSCGPSLTTHNQQILKDKLKDKLVICAKQSLNYLNDICDFHLLSAYNFQPYSYENKNTIKWWQLTACNMNGELNKIVNEWKHDIDIYIPIVSGPWITLEGSTAYTRNFDNWKKLSSDTQMLWGPGILYESGFPLCYLLGVKNIVTIGWDIGDLSKYNGQVHDYNWFNQHATDLYDIRMETGPDYTELKNTIECTKEMYDWFLENKIKVRILSEINPADSRFKRITLEDL